MNLYLDKRFFIVRKKKKDDSLIFVKDFRIVGDDLITSVKHTAVSPCLFYGDSFDAACTVSIFNKYLRHFHQFDDYEYFSFPFKLTSLSGSEEFDKWLKT